MIVPFNFNLNPVRIITDDGGEIWFFAKDVCDILGYANSRDMVKKLCRKSGVSNRYISELSNTYTLIVECPA